MKNKLKYFIFFMLAALVCTVSFSLLGCGLGGSSSNNGKPNTPSGTPTKTYNISTLSYRLDKTQFYYDGSPQTTGITLLDGGEVVAYVSPTSSHAELDIRFENNVEVGNATVILTAKGGSKTFFGSLTAQFSIIQAPKEPVEASTLADVNAFLADTRYSKVTLTADLTVESGEILNIPIGGVLEIIGRMFTNFGTIVNDGSLITGDDAILWNYGTLQNNGEITSQTAAYVYSNGQLNGVYRGLITKYERESVQSALVSGCIEESYSYNSREITPTVRLEVDGNAISAGHYAVQYTNNVNVGTATVTITANPTSTELFGEATVNFEITHGLISVSNKTALDSALSDEGYSRVIIGGYESVRPYTEDIIIPQGKTATLEINFEAKITVYGTLIVDRGLSKRNETLNITGGIDNYGNVEFVNKTFITDADVVNHEGGVMTVNYVLFVGKTLQNDGMLSLLESDEYGSLTVRGELVNDGTLTSQGNLAVGLLLTGEGRIINGGTFTSNGKFTVEGEVVNTGSLTFAGETHLKVPLTNDASARNSGTLFVYKDGCSIIGTVENYGVVYADQGYEFGVANVSNVEDGRVVIRPTVTTEYLNYPIATLPYDESVKKATLGLFNGVAEKDFREISRKYKGETVETDNPVESGEVEVTYEFYQTSTSCSGSITLTYVISRGTVTVNSFAKLTQKLALDGYERIKIDGNVTISENITVKENTVLEIIGGSEVFNQGTLTVNGSLIVGEGAKYYNETTASALVIGVNGSVENNGETYLNDEANGIGGTVYTRKDIASATVNQSQTSVTYTGSVLDIPEFTLTIDGETLTVGEDYSYETLNGNGYDGVNVTADNFKAYALVTANKTSKYFYGERELPFDILPMGTITVSTFSELKTALGKMREGTTKGNYNEVLLGGNISFTATKNAANIKLYVGENTSLDLNGYTASFTRPNYTYDYGTVDMYIYGKLVYRGASEVTISRGGLVNHFSENGTSVGYATTGDEVVNFVGTCKTTYLMNDVTGYINIEYGGGTLDLNGHTLYGTLRIDALSSGTTFRVCSTNGSGRIDDGTNGVCLHLGQDVKGDMIFENIYFVGTRQTDGYSSSFTDYIDCYKIEGGQWVLIPT